MNDIANYDFKNQENYYRPGHFNEILDVVVVSVDVGDDDELHESDEEVGPGGGVVVQQVQEVAAPGAGQGQTKEEPNYTHTSNHIDLLTSQPKPSEVLKKKNLKKN